MIGSLRPHSREVTIVGGGIAGMVAAFYLDRAGLKVTLIEASPRLGGMISTSRTEDGLSESAIHSLPASRAVRALFEELGVPLVALREDSKARFIVRDGKAMRFPMCLKPRELIQAFLRAYFILADSRIPSEEVTVEDWAKRHVGKTALEYLVDPFTTGIYGVSPSKLAMGAALPRLAVPAGHSLLSRMLGRRVREKKKPREKKPISAPRDGMQSFVDALARRLQERLGDRLKLNTPITRLPEAENVMLCVPASVAARLLEGADAETAHKLGAVIYSPLVSATAFVDPGAFDTEPKGLGVLMPSKERRSCLGILFNSSSFENRGTSTTLSFTAMFSDLSLGDAALEAGVLKDLGELFGCRAKQAKLVIHRWKEAIPRYDLALLLAWRSARAGWCAEPGRLLFGNYSGQVALRGMIEAAEALAQTLK